MTNLLNNKLYIAELQEYAKYDLNWEKLNNKTILLTGASGLVGRYFTDLIMYKNIHEDLNCTIVALCIDEASSKKVFSEYLNNQNFYLLIQDVKEEIKYSKKIDYIINAASNTYPIQYATDPIGTLTTSIMGTYNLLNYCKDHEVIKFLYISSFEVYGKVTDVEKMAENDFGSIDCTILRSCYLEGKRAAESLCIAFSEQQNVNTSILRLSRVFGPTMNIESSLATAQFLKKGINNEDIVLKSDGMQLYSYNYVGDAVTAILTVLLNGENKEAYNASDEKFDARLKEFATYVAKHSNKDVVFDLPDEIEKKGFSNSVMSILDSNKIKNIGWYVNSNLKAKIESTIDMLKNK